MHQPTDYPWNDDFDFADFRQQVEEFARLLRINQARGPYAFTWEAVVHLARLYASGTQMPPYSPLMPDDVDDERTASYVVSSGQADARRTRLNRLANSLRVVIGEEDDTFFAVDFPDEATVSQYSLSRELAFISEDLEKGAAEWDAGRHDDAAWTWIYGFEEGGWGEEALSALACLHYIAGERMSLLLGSPTPPPQADSAADPER